MLTSMTGKNIGADIKNEIEIKIISDKITTKLKPLMKELVENVLDSVYIDNQEKLSVNTKLNDKKLNISGIKNKFEYIDISYNLVKSQIQPLIDYIDNFNINNIPNDIKNNIYDNDYYKIYLDNNLFDYDDYLLNILDESVSVSHQMDILNVRPKVKLIETNDIIPAKLVAEELSKKYGIFFLSCNYLRKNQLSSDNEIISIKYLSNFINSPLVAISSGKEIKNKKGLTNLDILDIECMNYGYYRIRTSLYADPDTNQKYYLSIYNPVKDEPINVQLKKLDLIYHLSPIENRDNILLNGLIPSEGGRLYSYKDKRTFFITGNIRDFTYIKMMKRIYELNKSRNKNLTGIYDIWRIDTDDIPNNIEFYIDDNANNSIYIKDIFPADYIELYRTIDLNKSNITFDKIK